MVRTITYGITFEKQTNPVVSIPHPSKRLQNQEASADPDYQLQQWSVFNSERFIEVVIGLLGYAAK